MASVSWLMQRLNVVSRDEQLRPRVTKTTSSLPNSIWKFLTKISVEPHCPRFLNSVAFWIHTFLLENRNLSVVSINNWKKSTCCQLLFPVQSGKDCGIWWKLLDIKKKISQKCHSTPNVFCFVVPRPNLMCSCLSELSWKCQTTSVFTGSSVGEKVVCEVTWKAHWNELLGNTVIWNWVLGQIHMRGIPCPVNELCSRGNWLF